MKPNRIRFTIMRHCLAGSLVLLGAEIRGQAPFSESDNGTNEAGTHAKQTAAGLPGVSISRVGNWKSPSGIALGIQVVGTTAFLADGDALEILDVSNPSRPISAGRYSTGRGEYWGIRVVGNLAYVAARYSGLELVDVSNPRNTVRIGGYESASAGGCVEVVGNTVYVGDLSKGVLIVDASEPTNLKLTGQFQTDGDIEDIRVLGNLVYLVGPQTGLQIVDVSNPAKPIRVAKYNTGGYPWHLQVAGNFAYVADYSEGLVIIDVSIAANPVRIGGIEPVDITADIQVVSGQAYVLDTGVFRVVDVSQPANPVRLGGYRTSGGARACSVTGDFAFVADGNSGIQVLKLTPLARPSLHMAVRDGFPQLTITGEPDTRWVLRRANYIGHWLGNTKLPPITLTNEPFVLTDTNAVGELNWFYWLEEELNP